MRILLTAAFLALAAAATATRAADLKGKEDRERVTLSGRVAAVGDGQLKLAYDGGTVTVEVDDADPANELASLDEGAMVTVSGTIDKRFRDARIIEAGRVFDHQTKTAYYASAADEEADFSSYHYIPEPTKDAGHVTLTGTVKEIEGDVVTLDTGLGQTRVTTGLLQPSGNGVDDRARPQPGDRISVRGVLRNDLFEKDSLKATSIVILRDADAAGAAEPG